MVASGSVKVEGAPWRNDYVFQSKEKDLKNAGKIMKLNQFSTNPIIKANSLSKVVTPKNVNFF